MSKTKRINKRIKRIEDRFKTQVSKGIKGTDMDIEMHERRIEKLRGKHREETIKQERNMPESPLGFTMPHSPLNQNDSIAASKAWNRRKAEYMDRTHKFVGHPSERPITADENLAEWNREKNEFYYDTNRKKLRLIPTDDAEVQDEDFKSKLKKWQLSPLNQKEKILKQEKGYAGADVFLGEKYPHKPTEKVYNMTPNVSEKEAAGVREKFDRTYMKRGSHAHADSEFEKATYQLMNEGVIKETDNKSMPLIEKRMEENKRNK